jgi:hypothetical protein
MNQSRPACFHNHVHSNIIWTLCMWLHRLQQNNDLSAEESMSTHNFVQPIGYKWWIFRVHFTQRVMFLCTNIQKYFYRLIIWYFYERGFRILFVKFRAWSIMNYMQCYVFKKERCLQLHVVREHRIISDNKYCWHIRI